MHKFLNYLAVIANIRKDLRLNQFYVSGQNTFFFIITIVFNMSLVYSKFFLHIIIPRVPLVLANRPPLALVGIFTYHSIVSHASIYKVILRLTTIGRSQWHIQPSLYLTEESFFTSSTPLTSPCSNLIIIFPVKSVLTNLFNKLIALDSNSTNSLLGKLTSNFLWDGCSMASAIRVFARNLTVWQVRPTISFFAKRSIAC